MKDRAFESDFEVEVDETVEGFLGPRQDVGH